MPSKLTAETLAELRRLETSWIASDDGNRATRRLEYGVVLLAYAPALLAAADALAKIRAISADELDALQFSRRVGGVLDDLDRQPEAEM